MQVFIYFFVIASQKPEGIDWLVTAANEFWWQTNPQRRKLVPSQLR